MTRTRKSRPAGKQKAAAKSSNPFGALDAVPHAIAVLGGSGKIEFVNAAWRTAVERQLVAGRKGDDFYAALSANANEENRHAALHVMSAVRAVVQGDRTASSSQYRQRIGKKSIWFHVSVRRRADKKAGAVAIFEDRTEMREYYTDAVEANRTLRNVLDHLPRSALWKDLEGHIVGGNAAFFDEFGTENMVGESIDHIRWPPTVAASFRALDRIVVETGRRQATVVGVATGEGRTRWLDLASGPIKRGDGTTAGIINSCLDVTEEYELRDAVKRSEYRLRVALDGANMGAFDCDLTTGKMTYTDRCGEMLFYERGQLVDTIAGWIGLIHPDDRADAAAKYAAHIRGQTANYSNEKRMRAKDRSWVWVRETGQVVERAQDGTPTRLVSICLDITEEKQALERMKKTATRLRLATEASQIGTWEYDFKTGLMTWDAREFEIFGQSPYSFSPSSWMQCVHPEDQPRVRAAVKRMGENLLPFRETFRIVRPDGSLAYVQSMGAVEKSNDGTPLVATGTTVDVTEAHTAAEATLLAKQQLESFVVNAPAAVAMFDKETRYIAHSRRWLHDGRWGDESLVGKRHFDVFPNRNSKWNVILERCYAGETLKGTEETLERPDGTSIWVNWEVMPWRDHKGEIGGAIFAAEDVTAAIEARHQLEAANKRLSNYIATATDWLWEADARGKMTFVSDRFFETTKYAKDEIVGLPVSGFKLSDLHQSHDPEELRRFREWKDFRDLVFQLPVKPGSAYQGAFIYMRVSGKAQYDVQGNFTGYLGTATDITEAVHQGNAARQAQKLQAVGTLASGVAHEFNNILAIIRGHADLARRALERGDMPEEDLGHVIEAATRGSTLTKGLLTFGRKGAPADITTFDAGELLTEQRMFLRPLTGPQFELQVERPDAPALIHARRDTVAQAIMNLVVNARDASPKGGLIEMSVSVVNASAVLSRLADPPTEGRFVRVSVTDHGQGMSEAILQRIFEPFFTTKDVGKGTGLGLQFVYQLVTDSKGYINVVSQTGSGTRFDLYFPEAEPVAAILPTPNSSPDRYDGRTALVVDDEAALIGIYKAMLEDLGFNVLSFTDPEAALEAVDEHVGDLDLIVSDVLMPKIEGPHFAELALALHPETAVLFVTGQPDRGGKSGSSLPKDAFVLRKPFTRDDMSAILRKVFAANAGRSAA